MYKFRVNFKNNQICFLSEQEERIYKQLIDAIERTNSTVQLTIEEVSSKGLNDKQKSLFKYLISVLSEESGMTMAESYSTIYQHVFMESYIDIDKLNNEEFTKMINETVVILNDNFNIPIYHNESTGLFELLNK